MHFLLGPGLMPAFDAALLGYLMFPVWTRAASHSGDGLIGAPLLASSTLGIRLGVNEGGTCRRSSDHSHLLLGAALRIWMTVRAFDPTGALRPRLLLSAGSPATS